MRVRLSLALNFPKSITIRSWFRPCGWESARQLLTTGVDRGTPAADLETSFEEDAWVKTHLLAWLNIHWSAVTCMLQVAGVRAGFSIFLYHFNATRQNNLLLWRIACLICGGIVSQLRFWQKDNKHVQTVAATWRDRVDRAAVSAQLLSLITSNCC